MLRSINRRFEALLTPRIVRNVQRKKLTYLERDALVWLMTQVQHVESAGMPGEFIEAGCAKGGSSIVIASAKSQNRPLSIYDTFGMIPAPSERDGQDVHERYEVIRSGKSRGIDGDRYYGYEEDLMALVRREFVAAGFSPDTHNVRMVRGLYENTLRPNGDVAFAHIDCDWYDSVMVCLERIIPALRVGGRVVIDDYFVYSGCRAAVWDYFRHRMDAFRFINGPRLAVERIHTED